VSLILPFPAIDPVAIQIGSFGIRWYALAYLTGLLSGWWYMRWMTRQPPHPMPELAIDDFLVWTTLGVVLGGRLGYILFYKPSFYLSDPLQIFKVWQGGMSFHGGALGVVVAILLFCRQRGYNPLRLGDMVCCAVPIGLCLGRIANFINGELWGRPAPDFPYAMVFPTGGPLPRYPSQLFESALEGVLLLILLHLCWRVRKIRMNAGALSGLFLIGYGLARIAGEFFREPDSFLGYLWGGATMGQLLSLPMILVGLGLTLFALTRRESV